MGRVIWFRSKHLGKFCPRAFLRSAILTLFTCVGLSLTLACASKNLKPTPPAAPEEKPIATPEDVESKKESEVVEPPRPTAPEAKKEETDEMAVILGLMTPDHQLAPWEIRQRFDKLVRNKQTNFSKDLKQDRDRFSSEEKNRIDRFLEDQKKRRSDFKNEGGRSIDEIKKFNDQLERERQHFQTGQKEKRTQFEGSVQQKRQDFQDYVRDKQIQFDQAYKEYSRGYYDQQNPGRANGN